MFRDSIAGLILTFLYRSVVVFGVGVEIALNPPGVIDDSWCVLLGVYP